MSYSLPSDQYSGTVQGVSVSYNQETWNSILRIRNPTLKRLLEQFAVAAAIERGLSTIVILSIFHSTTINSRGQRVPAPMHSTIGAGTGQLNAHIEVSHFDPRADPANWYDNLTVTRVKWSDRATSSNASSPPAVSTPSQTGSQDGRSPPQAGGSTGSNAQWVRTSSNVQGRQWAWWDGTKYTGQYQ